MKSPALTISETDFQNSVIELARLNRWMVVHFRPAMTQSGRWMTPMQGDTGFPDLVLARRGRVVFIELKSEKGRQTPQQLAWMAALEDSGCAMYVFRPHDWDEIVFLLSRETTERAS